MFRAARGNPRVGVAARTQFCPGGILFLFALIGDRRLEHQKEIHRKKCIHRPPAPEIEEPANPNESQRKEGSYRKK